MVQNLAFTWGVCCDTPSEVHKTIQEQLNKHHCSNICKKATAKLYGWKLTGKWQVCEHCTQAKIRQQNIGHGSNQPSKIKGERLYIDVSSIKGRRYGRTKFWNLIVDEATRMKWSICLKQKSDLGKEMVKLNCMKRIKFCEVHSLRQLGRK